VERHGALEGGGLILTPPNDQGKWRIRSFVFQPAPLMVYVDDTVTLHFIGVQGPSHTIAIDGQAKPVVLKRGEMKTVTFDADKVGSLRYVSLHRQRIRNSKAIFACRPTSCQPDSTS
jgi:hypothetical protein